MVFLHVQTWLCSTAEPGAIHAVLRCHGTLPVEDRYKTVALLKQDPDRCRIEPREHLEILRNPGDTLLELTERSINNKFLHHPRG